MEFAGANLGIPGVTLMIIDGVGAPGVVVEDPGIVEVAAEKESSKFNFILSNFFATENIKKHPQKLLIIGPDPFFQYCQSAQIQPKPQFLFHKNLPPRDFSIMILVKAKKAVISR